MIVGVVGSRRRNTAKDKAMLIIKLGHLELTTGRLIKKIVTGDCDEGGDKFAKDIVDIFGYQLDVKRIKAPETGEEMDFNAHKWFDYLTICNIYYSRNEEIAKEPLDYLVALVTPDRKGGTENTIRHFRRLHKDWEEKLIII